LVTSHWLSRRFASFSPEVGDIHGPERSVPLTTSYDGQSPEARATLIEVQQRQKLLEMIYR